MGFDAAGTDNWDDRIVVPFSTSSRRLFERPYMEQVVFRVADAERVPEVAEQVRVARRAERILGLHDGRIVEDRRVQKATKTPHSSSAGPENLHAPPP
jgi:hypothetical protein